MFALKRAWRSGDSNPHNMRTECSIAMKVAFKWDATWPPLAICKVSGFGTPSQDKIKNVFILKK